MHVRLLSVAAVGTQSAWRACPQLEIIRQSLLADLSYALQVNHHVVLICQLDDVGPAEVTVHQTILSMQNFASPAACQCQPMQGLHSHPSE